MSKSALDAVKTKQLTSTAKAEDKPRLLFFYSPTNGRDRRVEGFLAQVLQRNRNQQTFSVHRIDIAARPDLAARFRIRETPTILIVQGNKVAARGHSPKGCVELTELMTPWLRF
jgi:thioredoxin-like negative regulator of GroEL